MNSAQTWPDNKAQPSTVVTENSQRPSSASQNLVSPWSLRVLCSLGAWTLRGVSGPTTGLCCMNVPHDGTTNPSLGRWEAQGWQAWPSRGEERPILA